MAIIYRGLHPMAASSDPDNKGPIVIQLAPGEVNDGFWVLAPNGSPLFAITANGRVKVNGMPVFLEGDSADHAATAPTAAAGTNAGTAPPVPVVSASARDMRGSITFGTGTTAAAGNLAVVTFSAAFDVAPKAVVVTPLNQATAALQLGVSALSATGFTVNSNVAPASSKTNATYGFYFAVFV